MISRKDSSSSIEVVDEEETKGDSNTHQLDLQSL